MVKVSSLLLLEERQQLNVLKEIDYWIPFQCAEIRFQQTGFTVNYFDNERDSSSARNQLFDLSILVSKLLLSG